MEAALVFIALVLVVAATQLRMKRHYGRLQGTALARDIGIAIAALVILIEGSRFWVDWDWWRGLGQLPTFWQYLRIRWLPQTAAAVAAAVVLMVVFALARHHCRTALARTSLFGIIGYPVSALLGILTSVNLINPWTIALFLGAQPAGAYTDPVFHKDLTFYMFRLPFYEMLFSWIATLAVLGVLIAAITSIAGSSAERMQEMRARVMAQMEGRGFAGSSSEVRPAPPVSIGNLVRAGAVVLLIIFAISQFFARYSLLYSSHGFLTGADFVDVSWGIPLLWIQIVGALGLAALILLVRRPAPGLAQRHFGQPRPSAWDEAVAPWVPRNTPRWLPGTVILVFLGLAIVPSIVRAAVAKFYVAPNELALETPYIHDHIHATRMAYNLEQTAHEEAFTPTQSPTLDLTQYPDTANNIRLWDQGPFQEDANQLQALRPYYDFPDVDVDRYDIDGHVRQVLIAARALDTSRLPDSAQTWVNLRLQYTHGYGAVAALVNTSTPEGEPVMILKDAPPTGPFRDFQITRSGLYFAEDTTVPVYVDTTQPEFDYPKGDDNAYTTYSGSAGVVLSNSMLRLAAAIQQNDINVILTHYFTARTRLLLHRQVLDRVETIAPFLTYDSNPYLVIDSRGHLFWMIDAYTTSQLHPYSEPIQIGDQEVNYIRNSVKITIDAYNGTVHFYVFDNKDPVLRAYRNVFPHLFLPRSAMPKDLLAHIRYPRALFEAQAQIARLYHMRDPQVFYNKEDQWDIAKQVVSQELSEPTRPYYVMLQLPGDSKAEFVLLVPFTSHSRDNLIAWVAARCDPAHYGQLIFYRLPKNQLIYGPLQIQSRVDQNRNISKDLSLWNQQGSRVIRTATLVLPVGGTFVYVDPIYIQAPQAQLPELKKMVLAVGNRLVYSNDLPNAIATLAQPPSDQDTAASDLNPAAAPPVLSSAGTQATGPPAVVASSAPALPRAVLETVQAHLNRYQQLTAQGKFAEAGAELQAAQQALKKALGGSPQQRR
ncbi:MAG: UPF0182 family protein [Terriglobales bacterium]